MTQTAKYDRIVHMRTRRRKGFLFGRVRPVNVKITVTAGVILAVVLLAVLIKPEPQLMNSAEVSIVRDRGVLRVGVYDDMPGFSDKGYGLERDLAIMLAERILPDRGEDAVEFVPVTDRTVQAKLDKGMIDVAIAQQIRFDNTSKYDYSVPYYTDTCSFVVLPGNENIDLAGKTVGTIQTCKASSLLKSAVSQGVMNVVQKNFASYPEMLDAIKNGTIDAALMRSAVTKKYVSTNELSFHKELFGRIDYAMAASLDSPALMQLANMMLDELKANGVLERMTLESGLPVYRPADEG
jgi:ABC-type amino acid transport substrate-binding protein